MAPFQARQYITRQLFVDIFYGVKVMIQASTDVFERSECCVSSFLVSRRQHDAGKGQSRLRANLGINLREIPSTFVRMVLRTTSVVFLYPMQILW
jgi:hypothetical protein